MAEKTDPRKTPALRIRSYPARFYRAGLEFTTEARDIPVANLTRAQIDALRAEPQLHVTEVVVDAPADAAAR